MIYRFEIVERSVVGVVCETDGRIIFGLASGFGSGRYVRAELANDLDAFWHAIKLNRRLSARNLAQEWSDVLARSDAQTDDSDDSAPVHVRGRQGDRRAHHFRR